MPPNRWRVSWSTGAFTFGVGYVLFTIAVMPEPPVSGLLRNVLALSALTLGGLGFLVALVSTVFAPRTSPALARATKNKLGVYIDSRQGRHLIVFTTAALATLAVLALMFLPIAPLLRPLPEVLTFAVFVLASLTLLGGGSVALYTWISSDFSPGISASALWGSAAGFIFPALYTSDTTVRTLLLVFAAPMLAQGLKTCGTGAIKALCSSGQHSHSTWDSRRYL